MRQIWAAVVITCAVMLAFPAAAQVVPPEQIDDPESRALQQKYWRQLNALGEDLAAEHFPYHFYFSRKLDIDEKKQRHTDQRSIRFARFHGRMLLVITGNYYAAYSRELMGREQRASQSFNDLLLPLLRIAVHDFQNNPDVEGYAIETSHHVLGKVWNITVESPENLFLVLPQRPARRLIQASDSTGQLSALAEAEVLLNGQTVSLLPTGDIARQ